MGTYTAIGIYKIFKVLLETSRGLHIIGGTSQPATTLPASMSVVNARRTSAFVEGALPAKILSLQTLLFQCSMYKDNLSDCTRDTFVDAVESLFVLP